MENPDDTEKKMNKARSSINYAIPTNTVKLKSEPGKRKSFNVNEAVRSLDLALCRLKKSKLVNGEYVPGAAASSTPGSPVRREPIDMFMDVSPSSQFGQSATNTSMMSMNFSHYELVRNLSSSNCNSDGAFSYSTCSAHPRPADSAVKDEHLERFFRSAEMWTQRYKDGPANLRFNIRDK